ncbi:MAG: hypothetical protein LHV68_01435 [Elusimicrobia bacterium]|nr:hypothetical protein [Candidatus Liberimonas magnetica]
MRKMNFDDFIKTKKDIFFKVPAMLGRKRGAKRRQRDPEEREALMMLDLARYKQWIKNGDLIEVSPKKYVVAKVFDE